MPGMNRTGPTGAGPMTGRGLGACGASARGGYGRGACRGNGTGRGAGFGNGRGQSVGPGRELGWFSVGNGDSEGAAGINVALEARAKFLRAELARTEALLKAPRRRSSR
ncbi:MAG: hypothetical protein CVV47_06740 [Spirochaetae bacterium HGW-Spirochaetae-3]|nr:MAG: hypothetical protein CVV47_06740 [Spirochaetae bacterium HGW-Spirochaetae-3]